MNQNYDIKCACCANIVRSRDPITIFTFLRCNDCEFIHNQIINSTVDQSYVHDEYYVEITEKIIPKYGAYMRPIVIIKKCYPILIKFICNGINIDNIKNYYKRFDDLNTIIIDSFLIKKHV